MQTRPTHLAPTTLSRAKKDFRKNGPRMSSQQARQLERGAELYARAQKIKDNEQRRKANARKKQEKEQREREARRRMGLPSPQPYLSPRQNLLVNFLQKPLQRKEEEFTGRTHYAEQLLDNSAADSWIDEDLNDEAILSAVEDYDPLLDQPDETIRPISNTMSDTAVEERDEWEDFLDSNTQIARDLSAAPGTPISNAIQSPGAGGTEYVSLLSTQDLNLSTTDLEELGVLVAPTHT